METLIIEKKDDGRRLDALLADRITELSRSRIKGLINSGDILVDKTKRKAGYNVKIGEIVEICIPEPEDAQILPEAMDLDIIFEDEDIIVVNKPSGMVVHPAPGNYQGTLVNGLLDHTGNLSTINGVIRPGIVHRIDKDTSGVLVVAKNDAAHKSLTEQLSEHTMDREYLGLVTGLLDNDAGTIDMPIGRHPGDRIKMAVVKENSKEAITHFKVIRRLSAGFTMVRFKLETGRTHQIRVHMKEIGYPLVNDPLYGRPNKGFDPEFGQYLHAEKLGFNHPKTGEHLVFEALPPETFVRTVSDLDNP